MLDIVGHFAYFGIFVGTLLIGKENIIGWKFRIVGEIIWIVLGFLMGMSSIWLWGFAFVIADGLGWYKWSKKQ